MHGKTKRRKRRNAKYSERTPERNNSIAEMRGFGLDDVGRRLWGRLTGYSRRSLAETAFSRLKKMFGPSFFSREEARQVVEGHLKCLMMNRMLQATK